MAEDKDILEIVNALLMVIDGKDHYTMSHSLLVMDYTQLIAVRLGLSKREQKNVRFAGFLHDIGKIAIPDAILQKPGRLSPEEYEKIKTHPQESAKIIGQITRLKNVLPLVLYHHERLDGSGYLEKRKNEEIPLGSKILAIADTYSALIAGRPYQAPLHAAEAARILKNLEKTLDQSLVKIFLEEAAKVKG